MIFYQKGLHSCELLLETVVCSKSKHLCSCTLIIIKASLGYYSRAATILLSSPIELQAATK